MHEMPRIELHYMSTKSQRLDGVRLLLQHGVDSHAQDDERRTPFHVASASESSELNRDIMQLLLEHGAEDHRTQ